MRIAIHQPDYLPYLGTFYNFYLADVFVHLDDVQYSNSNFHNFNNIKTPQGNCRIKIPIEYSFGDKILQVRTKDELGWKEKHLKTIRMNYLRSKYFVDFFPQLEELLMTKYNNLAEMNISVNETIAQAFGFSTKFVRSSDMDISTAREERVIDICKQLNASTYISGIGGKNYQNEQNFKQEGIQLAYTDYTSFEYTQLWQSFIPNLSIVDYIFNCGFDWDNVVNHVKKFSERKLNK